MKAYLTKNGVLVVIPQTETEEFALSQWSNLNRTSYGETRVMDGESSQLRGSSVLTLDAEDD